MCDEMRAGQGVPVDEILWISARPYLYCSDAHPVTYLELLLWVRVAEANLHQLHALLPDFLYRFTSEP